MTQMLRFKVKTTPNRTTVRKMLQALFLQHFNGFILQRLLFVKKFTLYFRRLIFFLWSIVIVLLLQQVHCQKPPVYTAESCSNESVFWVFSTNCDPTKPYNKFLINLVCSVCTGMYCLTKNLRQYFPVQTSHSVSRLRLGDYKLTLKVLCELFFLFLKIFSSLFHAILPKFPNNVVHDSYPF